MKFSTINIITPHVFNDFSPNHIKSDNSLALERFSGLPPQDCRIICNHANMVVQPWSRKNDLGTPLLHLKAFERESIFYMYIFKLFPPHVKYVMFPLH